MMWMFLALLGAVAAAGVADHMVQTAGSGEEPDDQPDDGATMEQADTVDLLAVETSPGPIDTLPVMPESGGLEDEAPGPNTPRPDLPPDLTPVPEHYLYGWEEDDEYISTDDPVPPPSDDYIEAGVDGTPVMGGDGDDTLVGSGSDYRLEGESGDDSLIGGFGDDVLTGTEGSDLLNGGGGDDTLIGYTPDADGRDIDGGDFLNGGAGDDLIILGSGDVASGGGGGDDFVLGEWIDPGDPPVIGDFSGEDGLIITYDGTGPEPVIAMAYDADAGGVVVRMNGAVLGVLQGVDSVDPEAVTLMPLTP